MSVTIDLTNILSKIQPTETPFYLNIKNTLDKYEMIKIIVKPRARFIPRWLHEKLCYLFFGIELKTKDVYITWSTYEKLKPIGTTGEVSV